MDIKDECEEFKRVFCGTIDSFSALLTAAEAIIVDIDSINAINKDTTDRLRSAIKLVKGQ